MNDGVKKQVYILELTEDELRAMEMALKNSNADCTQQKLLLRVFMLPELGRAARKAWVKVAKAQRDISVAVGSGSDKRADYQAIIRAAISKETTEA